MWCDDEQNDDKIKWCQNELWCLWPEDKTKQHASKIWIWPVLTYLKI